MKRKHGINRIITIVLILICAGVSAQTKLDSLYSVWQDKKQTDSTRTAAYYEYISKGFLYSNPDTAIVLAQALLSYGEQHKYPKAKANAYNLLGISSFVKSDFPKALEYFQHSLKINEEIGDKQGMAKTINNIGNIYKDQGDNPKALEYYQRSLKIYQEIGDKQGMAKTINNIGIIYKAQDDNPKALEYYQRSLKISEEIGDKQGMAIAIGNIGIIYKAQGDYPKALEYYQRCLKIFEEFGDKKGMANTIGNIGIIYKAQGDYPKALEYYQRSLKISEEIGDNLGMATTIKSIGTIYQKQGDYPKALEYCKKSLGISEEIGALSKQKEACNCLYDTYKAMGKGNEALVYMEKIKVIDDSLHSEETSKKLQQMEFAKQVFADSMATAAKEHLAEEAHQEELRKSTQTRNYLIGGGLFLLLMVGGVYSRLRYVRKSKASLQIEKDRSENLLLNILPEEIAQELKLYGKAEARDFDLVSILFTDFKGFTEASAKMSAALLVCEINACFEAFDEIMEKYQIEKIKTIGDSYMAAGGLPVPTDNSVKNTILAALEMQTFITKRKADNEAQNKPAFEMRVGIHTGPVVAGIVGVKKFQYDIWGDTVNTASRMESNGAVGKVNISQSTYEVIKNDADFVCVSRGKIEAKGKGEIEMWFVEGRI